MFFFLKKGIAWILQQVCKISKDFGLYFKNI
jgi:3-methyladenine DNA glycosylase AlkD